MTRVFSPLRRSQLPFAFATDRECIACGVETCWQPNVAKLRMAVIPNTLELAELWVSPPLAAEAKEKPHLDVTGPAQALAFDAAGNVVQERMFPHCVRGGRGRAWGA